MKQFIFNHLKNISGWRTNRKLVIFSVDDYGNVRLDSKTALRNLKKLKISFNSHFDIYDTLETRKDLEDLFEVLSSVKDQNGNSAIFTAYALPCNIDFQAMADNGYSKYEYELLPRTYQKLSLKYSKEYSGAWKLWNEGIEKKLIKPQFHGREHFSLNVFEDLLKKKCHSLLEVLKQNSHVTISEHKNYKYNWTASYAFSDRNETKTFIENVKSGLFCFKKVFGYDPKVFTPPSQQFPLHLENNLKVLGLDFIDRPRFLKRQLGNGKYQNETNKLGDGDVIKKIVRNVIFEPTTKIVSDWVNFSFKQIEAAFMMKKPANISSHRVNYCGYIDPKNREIGLNALSRLLKKIVKKWPDVEFISSDKLGELIQKFQD